MSGRGKHEEMRQGVAKPRVRVIETTYVTIPDPSNFKFIVQSLTGEQEKTVGRKRVCFDSEGEVAGKSGGADQDKRQCGGFGDAGVSRFVKGESFKDELQSILVPESPPLEEQWKWPLFNDFDDDRTLDHLTSSTHYFDA